MTRSATAPAARPTLTTRPGASRKLLARKASEKVASGPIVDGIEDSLPAAPTELDPCSAPAAAKTVVSVPPMSSAGPDPSAAPAGFSKAILPPAAGSAPQPVPTWSDEDERAVGQAQGRRLPHPWPRRRRSTDNRGQHRAQSQHDGRRNRRACRRARRYWAERGRQAAYKVVNLSFGSR